MLKFRRTTVTLNGRETQGYSVAGLDPTRFRGLQITVVKHNYGWKAYETTTGLSLTLDYALEASN